MRNGTPARCAESASAFRLYAGPGEFSPAATCSRGSSKKRARFRKHTARKREANEKTHTQIDDDHCAGAFGWMPSCIQDSDPANYRAAQFHPGGQAYRRGKTGKQFEPDHEL